MKKLGLVLIVVSMLACFSFANPFVEAGGDSWSVLEGDLDAVTTAINGMQPTITGRSWLYCLCSLGYLSCSWLSNLLRGSSSLFQSSELEEGGRVRLPFF